MRIVSNRLNKIFIMLIVKRTRMTKLIKSTNWINLLETYNRLKKRIDLLHFVVRIRAIITAASCNDVTSSCLPSNRLFHETVYRFDVLIETLVVEVIRKQRHLEKSCSRIHCADTKITTSKMIFHFVYVHRFSIRLPAIFHSFKNRDTQL